MSEERLDPKFANQLKESLTSVGVNKIVLKLTSQCFDTCYGGYASNKMPGSNDRRQETCLENCTRRLVESYDFLNKHLEKMQLKM